MGNCCTSQQNNHVLGYELPNKQREYKREENQTTVDTEFHNIITFLLYDQQKKLINECQIPIHQASISIIDILPILETKFQELKIWAAYYCNQQQTIEIDSNLQNFDGNCIQVMLSEIQLGKLSNIENTDFNVNKSWINELKNSNLQNNTMKYQQDLENHYIEQAYMLHRIRMRYGKCRTLQEIEEESIAGASIIENSNPAFVDASKQEHIKTIPICKNTQSNMSEYIIIQNSDGMGSTNTSQELENTE